MAKCVEKTYLLFRKNQGADGETDDQVEAEDGEDVVPVVRRVGGEVRKIDHSSLPFVARTECCETLGVLFGSTLPGIWILDYGDSSR